MKPGKYNIKFYRATTLTVTVTYLVNNVAVVLGGYTADMQVRVAPDSGTIITEFTTENGGITIDGPTGTITIFMSAEDTANLPIGEFQYDLNITSDSGTVTKLMRGAFVVKDPVTE